jgi:glycosyltransferase involved in cell wall biosynthesis
MTRKSMNTRVAVIILTFNEERHIARCIESIRLFAYEVFIVDSGSTDRTVEIAQSMGAQVFSNPWVNHATQFNWALDNLPLSGDWVMRLDADEYVTEALAQEIKTRLPDMASTVSGVYVNRRVYFMGKWIRHGGYYPIRLLRIWRRGMGRCEQRWMDEHVYISGPGEKIIFAGDIVDDNKNNITWWTAKHNGYATREMIDLLNIRYGFGKPDGIESEAMAQQESRKRWVKEKIYSRLPLGLRALVYFLYRFIVRGGFLDGYRGMIFHVLQGFWYRFLVDVKVYEFESKMRAEGLDAKTLLRKEYGVEVE